MMVHLSGSTYVNVDNVESINVFRDSLEVEVTFRSGDKIVFSVDSTDKAEKKAKKMANHINEQISTPPDPEPTL